MLYRFFILAVLYGVGFVIAIPVKRIFDTWLSEIPAAGFADFSTLELALIGIIPVIYIVFTVFVNPTRKFLRGEHPWHEPRKPAEKPTYYYHKDIGG